MGVKGSDDKSLLLLLQSATNSERAKAYHLFLEKYKSYLAKIIQRNTATYKNIDADFLLDESIEKIIENAKNFKIEDANKFKSWISIIARNHCIDAIRKQQAKQRKDKRAAAKQGTTEKDDYGLADEDFKSILKKIESEAQRQALFLKFVNKLKYQEIAKKMDLPINTVRSHIRRGKQNLKKVLGDKKK